MGIPLRPARWLGAALLLAGAAACTDVFVDDWLGGPTDGPGYDDGTYEDGPLVGPYGDVDDRRYDDDAWYDHEGTRYRRAPSPGPGRVYVYRDPIHGTVPGGRLYEDRYGTVREVGTGREVIVIRRDDLEDRRRYAIDRQRERERDREREREERSRAEERARERREDERRRRAEAEQAEQARDAERAKEAQRERAEREQRKIEQKAAEAERRAAEAERKALEQQQAAERKKQEAAEAERKKKAPVSPAAR